MSNPPPVLMKTCASCGLRKPLSAFLQITGPDGTTYTNICASCRKANLEASSQKTERDETTSSDTSHTIDTKSKVKADTDKRDLRKQIEEDYFKDREKDQDIEITKSEKQQFHVKGEIKHREDFIKKSSFLDNPRNKQNTDATKIFGSAAHSSEAEKFNFNAPVEDTRTPKIKHSGAVFNQFKTWLGKSAPIGRSAIPDKTQPAKDAPTKDDVTEYIDNTWGPGSRKR